MLTVLKVAARRLRGKGHRTHRTLTALLVLGLTAVLGPVLASPAAGSEGDDEKVTFTVGLLNEVDSFNPFKGIEGPAFEMYYLMYDQLIGYSMEDLSPVPELAEEWETSDDGLTWTFHMRDDTSWNDGEPLTADDVAFTYQRVLDGGVFADTWISYLNNVDTVTATDPQTVELQLKRPSATLPLLPIPIMPEHIWKDISEEEANTYANEPDDGPVVGSGTFTLVEGTAGGSTYRLEANPESWEGTPHIDEVVFRVFKAEDPAVQALIKGEIDALHDITPLQIEALQKQEGITAQMGTDAYFEHYGFNTGAIQTDESEPDFGEPIGDGNPALKDPAFRHALGYAIDKDVLLENAYQGAAEPGQTIVPDIITDFHWSPPEDEAFTFDLEKAGQLLDEAGYEVGADGLRTMPDGSPIGTLRLIGRPEEKRSIRSMDYLKEWLGEIGIESEVIAQESGALTNTILDGEYDIFHWGWYVEADPDGMLSYVTCGQLGNWSDTWYCNEEYDELYEAQAVELDDEKRQEMVKQMQQILWEDSPYLVIGYTKTGQAFRSDRFACFQPQPDPGGVILVQYGATNYSLARPAEEAGDCDGITSALGATLDSGGGSGDDGGASTGVLVAGGVLLLGLVGGLAFFAGRRRSTVDDRE